MIVDVAIGVQERVGGEAEEVFLDVLASLVVPAGGGPRQIVGLGQLDDPDCLVETLGIAPAAKLGEDTGAAPAILACGVARIVVGELDEDALYLAGIFHVAG